MFGKGKTQMSVNDRFIMDAGRKAGNLKQPPAAAKAKSATGPVVAKMGVKGRNNLGAIGKAKPE